MYIQQLGEIVLLPHHNTVGVCNQKTDSIRIKLHWGAFVSSMLTDRQTWRS